MIGRQWALLVGVNRYQHASSNLRAGAAFDDLRGAVADVIEMRWLLEHHFGFDPGRILTLTDEDATRRNILAAIHDHLAARAEPDDAVLFHFSGHGSHVWRDATQAREGTLVAHDSRATEQGDITGSALSQALRAVPARHVAVALDCCHAGNLLLSRDLRRTRFIPPQQGRTHDAPTTTRGLSIDTSSAPFVLLAAAGPLEPAIEIPTSAGARGAFTWALSHAARRAAPAATYRDLIEATREEVRRQCAIQTPRVEGVLADHVLFGSRAIVRRPYLFASPNDDGTVRLSGGSVVGVTAGSRYAIYAHDSPGPDDGPAAPPLADVDVVAVKAVESTAKIVTGGPVKVAPSRAVEIAHHHGTPRIRVGLHGLEELAIRLREHSQLTLISLDGAAHAPAAAGPATDDDRLCDLVGSRHDGTIVIQVPAFDVSARVPCGLDDATLFDHAAQRILHWAKWLNVLRIDNPSGRLRVALTVEGAGHMESRGRRISLDFAGGFDYAVTNESDVPVYVSVLALGDDGSVAVVFPPGRGPRQVMPGEAVRDHLSVDMSVGHTSERDILKVVATLQPCDLSVLEMTRTHGPSRGPRNALEQILDEAALGSRAVCRYVSTDWTTAHVVLDVVRGD